MFKVGDKVKITKIFCSIDKKQLGKIATISGIREDVINLDFEEDWDGNSACDTSPNDNGYNMWLSQIGGKPEKYLSLLSNQENNYEIY